jgi:cellulose synthase/poly-beta-1,6-N-acetylglucosamine synthase-like glycosyltransferase
MLAILDMQQNGYDVVQVCLRRRSFHMHITCSCALDAVHNHAIFTMPYAQGACSIRRDGFLSWIVAAEFEDMYNVGHRGRTSLFGIGVFGGSNGCWKRELLADIKMDPTMLTEDIDSSLRATLQGALRLS